MTVLGPLCTQTRTLETNMQSNTRIIISLIALALLDTIIPVPITAIVLLYVLGQKPPWFKDLIDRVYGSSS